MICCGAEVSCGLIKLGVGHLAGDSAFPDQLIQAELVEIQPLAHLIRMPPDRGRPDRFMGFLCIRGFGLIDTWFLRHKLSTDSLANGVSYLADGLKAHLHTICPHIGNQASGLTAQVDTFIKFLCNLHCPAG